MIDTDRLALIYRRFGENGWESRRVRLRVGGGSYKGQYTSYLQARWALQQIQEWGTALRTGMPMRQVPRPREIGRYRD